MRSSLAVLFLFFCLQNLSAQENSIIEKTPIRGREISTLTAMSLDLLPGGGHYYLGNYISGSVFAVIKTGALMSGYYFYESWQKSRDRENGTAKRKKNSDRAAQRFTFSVFGTTAAYGISWYKVYTDCSDINYRAQPVFEIGSAPDDSGFCASIGLSRSF